MVKVVRTPDFARKVFSPEQLSGWAKGATPGPAKSKRKKRRRKVDLVSTESTSAVR